MHKIHQHWRPPRVCSLPTPLLSIKMTSLRGEVLRPEPPGALHAQDSDDGDGPENSLPTVLNNTVSTVDHFRFLGAFFFYRDLSCSSHMHTGPARPSRDCTSCGNLRSTQEQVMFYMCLCSSITLWFSSSTMQDRPDCSKQSGLQIGSYGPIFIQGF